MKYLVFMLVFMFASPVFANNLLEDRILSNAIIDVKIHHKYSENLMTYDDMPDFAYLIGKEYNIGETLRAVVFLESAFGKNGRIGDNGLSRGVTQIQIPTAKFILNNLMKIKQHFSDAEISMLLTYNDKVCIIMSKHYLKYLMDKFKNKPANWSHAVLSYNRGPTLVSTYGIINDPNDYVKKAKTFIKRSRIKTL